MAMIPVTGFQPNLDPVTTNTANIIDCENLVPTNKGMRSVKQGEKLTSVPVPEVVLNGFSFLLLDTTSRTFACSSTKIYEYLAGSWLNVSKSGNYVTPDGNTWRMCQFGDVTIATNGNAPVQASTGGGAFSDLAGSPPKARICETTQGAVFLFNYNDGVSNVPDGWWASGTYDHTAWSPSLQTQAANGRLFDSPGEIVGAKQMANAIVAYKQNSFYLGEYVDHKIIWSWRQVSENTGVYSHEAIVNVEDTHYFLGANGLFKYDGSRLEPLGSLEVKEWLRENINLNLVDKVKGFYDNKHSLVYWYYPSNNSTGELDTALVYHTVTGKFGKVSRQLKAIVNLTLPNLTWGEVGNLYLTWGEWPTEIQWASSSFYGSGIGHSYFGLDGYVYQAEQGTPAPSTLKTGDIGDDSLNTILNRVRVRFFKQPLDVSMQHSFKVGLAGNLQTGVNVSMKDNKFDLTKSARFHNLSFTFNGEFEIAALDVNLVPNGSR